jgi:hypothetical protein
MANNKFKYLICFVTSSFMFSVLPGCGSASERDFSHHPVLFVHGHGLSASDWEQAIEYLRQKGYPAEYLHAVNIKPSRMANIRAAKTVIQEAALSLLDNAKTAAQNNKYKGQLPQRIDIVSHSMGAVSSRWFVAKLQPHYVRTWISLAGANHGSNALCNHTDAGANDLCPAYARTAEESKVQLDLNGTPRAPIDETPYGIGVDRKKIQRIDPDSHRSILYFTVRIEPDNWIKPEHSAILDGAGGVPVKIQRGTPVIETTPGNFLFKADVDHDSLPRHSQLIRFLALLLAVRDVGGR